MTPKKKVDAEKKAEKVESEKKVKKATSITDLPGIGPATADKLVEAGFSTFS